MMFPDVVHSEKLGLDFSFHRGIKDEHVKELIIYTQDLTDIGIQENTTDMKKANGKPGRFSSREAYDEWLGKGREIYTLIDPETSRLAGIVWLGREKIPTEGNTFVDGFDPSRYGITYAVRMYGKTRGAKVSAEFSRKAIEKFRQTETYLGSEKKGIWLEVNVDNEAGKNTYSNIGYKQVSKTTANGRLIMVLPE